MSIMKLIYKTLIELKKVMEIHIVFWQETMQNLLISDVFVVIYLLYMLSGKLITLIFA